MACPGSIEAEAEFPNETSSYAAEGTAAHALAEHCLRTDCDAASQIGETFESHTVDAAMAEAVQSYLDYVRALPGDLLVEERLDLSAYIPGSFGTGDAIVVDDDTITVVDLKFGKGVRVGAEDNPQAMLYGVGALDAFGFLGDFEHVKLSIVQPRLDHVSEHVMRVDALLDWAVNEVRQAANSALMPGAERVPGEKQCRFCRAKGTCRALAAHSLKTVMDGFEPQFAPIKLKGVDDLSIEEVATLLPQFDLITTWIKSVQAHAIGAAERGEIVPGYKLVNGLARRTWADEDAAGKALQRKLGAKAAWRKSPITITDAEKALGKNDPIIAKHTTKPQGKPVLAPLSDKRPAIEVDPTAGFENAA
jgi:hypothetical protein